MVLSANGTASRTSSGSSSRANAPPRPSAASASATELSAYRFGEQPSSRTARKNARKMDESDIDAGREVNPRSTSESNLADPLSAPAHAPAHHVAGAAEGPGEKPGGTAVERWMLVAIVL